METYRTIHGRKRGSMTNEEASCVLHCPDAYGGIYGQKYGEALAHCFELLKREPLTDTEQRIFLAAMSREEKACREVCSDGDGVDLVAVCHRIERKVKEALWE